MDNYIKQLPIILLTVFATGVVAGILLLSSLSDKC